MVQIKNANHELAQEKHFIEEQILNAKANQEKLLLKLDGLKHEYEELVEEDNNRTNDQLPAFDLRLTQGNIRNVTQL